MRAPSLDEKGSFLGPPWEELYRRGCEGERLTGMQGSKLKGREMVFRSGSLAEDGGGKWRGNLNSVPLTWDWSGLVRRLLDWRGREHTKSR